MEFASNNDVHFEQSRKRNVDSILHMTPAVKLPRLSTPDCLLNSNKKLSTAERLNSEMANTIIEMTPSNSPEEVDGDSCNFRRFGTRDRKRTDFFTPLSIDEGHHSDGDGGLKLSKQQSQTKLSNTRRVLQFEQLPVVEEESSSNFVSVSQQPPIEAIPLLKEELVKVVHYVTCCNKINEPQ